MSERLVVLTDEEILLLEGVVLEGVVNANRVRGRLQGEGDWIAGREIQRKLRAVLEQSELISDDRAVGDAAYLLRRVAALVRSDDEARANPLAELSSEATSWLAAHEPFPSALHRGGGER